MTNKEKKPNANGMNVTQQKTLDDLTVSLREYIDLRFGVQEAAATEAKRLAAVALDKAETALTKRLDLMNEFRGALDDSAKSFITRTEYDIMHQRLVEDVKNLQQSVNGKVTRREFDEHITQYGTMKTDVDIAKGKASQGSVYFGYAVAIIGVVLSIIAFFH